ncbi:Aste57867_19540 [Aphanomyces stellatus]|uniref:Aste57867_19540 protein n=1 Tax=Aphanomyces stellatus TaxID=120398 RepID=A0A485LEQ0_9STRA|nr:hypothetical protein As57867_019476 [Aphanomyces stellatus]VFT96247.1 Aste57867_19540 [Aphanomyces stellatus]
MSLAFLAKKSWHTSNLSNVEKVWKAEQKAALEEKKLLEWKKNVEEERQLKELRELQAKASGGAAKPVERVDWMYEGPMAGSQREKTAEEYLLGKEYHEKPEASELKQLASQPGSLYMAAAPSIVNDSFSRLNEDPMMLIKKQQKEAQLNILKNPVKMKRIKDKVEQELKERKAEKKAKKEAKKAKKESKKSKKHARDDDDDDVRGGSRTSRREDSPDASRHHAIAHRDFADDARSPRRRDPSRDDRNRRDRSAERRSDRRRDDRDRSPMRRRRSPSPPRRSPERRRRGSPSPSPHRQRRQSPSPRRPSRRGPSFDRSPRRLASRPDEEERQERPAPLKGYGLLGAENARKCKDIDTTSLGPSRKFLDQALEKRQREEAEKEERFKRARAFTDEVSKEDKDARVRAMLEDAKRREDALEARLKKKQVSNFGDGEESKTQQNPTFLRDLHDAAYVHTKDSMEDRLARNKHYIQRNADSKNFMQR